MTRPLAMAMSASRLRSSDSYFVATPFSILLIVGNDSVLKLAVTKSRSSSPRYLRGVPDHARSCSRLQRWNEGDARSPAPQESAQTGFVSLSSARRGTWRP